jgi:hypothetical protein
MAHTAASVTRIVARSSVSPPVTRAPAPALHVTVPFSASSSLSPSDTLDPRAGGHSSLLIKPVNAGTPPAALIVP